MDPDPESRASAPLGPVYVLPPDQRPWLPARGVPRALRQAYYAALNTDHRFADDLRALFQALDRHAAEAGGPADERWWQAVWGLALDPETVESPFTAVLPQARAAVVAFCERWPLPERVHEDLYATDRQRRANPPHGCDQPLGTGLVSGELGAHAGLL
ncbi:MAG TPA: hypothetical protein VKZ60_17480, partial [Chloroflexota bacterium]|nr:hypothetical protein [Chloroflexota bacterium]